MTTSHLTPAQQVQIDNRDDSGQWRAKTHGETDDGAGVLGLNDLQAQSHPVRSVDDLLAPRDAAADIEEAQEAIDGLKAGDREAQVNYTRAMAKLAATPEGRGEVNANPDHYLHDEAYDGIGFQADEIFESNSKDAQAREHAVAALRASGTGQNTRELSTDDAQAYPTTMLVERFKIRTPADPEHEPLHPDLMRVYHHGSDGSIGLRPDHGGDLTFINTESGTVSTGTFGHTADARIDDEGNIITQGGDPAQSIEMVLRPVDETPKYSATKTLEGIRRGQRGEIKNVHPMSADTLLTPGRRITLDNPLKQNRMPKKTPSKHPGRITDVTHTSIEIMDDRGDTHSVPRPSMTGRRDKTWTLDPKDRLKTETDHTASGELTTWRIGFEIDEPTPYD